MPRSPSSGSPAARQGVRGWLMGFTRRVDAWASNDMAMMLAVAGALALYYLVPTPLLSWPFLALYAALAWLRLDIALSLLPLAFPFWYVPKRVGGHTVFPLSEIALAVCAGAALAHEATRLAQPDGAGRLALRLRAQAARLGWPLGLGALGLVVAGALGVLVARRPHEALRAYRWEIVEPLLYLALVLLYARGPRALRRLVWALLASALVLAGLATVQIAFAHVTFSPLAAGNRLVPLVAGPDGILRATAFVYGSGNSLGAYLERALPIALALALQGGPLRLASPIARRERVAAAVVCMACLPALYWSASRGAWVATAAAAGVVVCLALGRPWLLAALGALGAVVALWQRGPLAAAVLAGHNGSGEVRTLVWLAAWHMIRDHPLLGIGLDQFLYYYSNLYTTHPYWITVLNGHPTLAWREPDLAHPHNLVLDLWLSVGLLGLAAFVVVVGAFAWRCVRLWRAAQRRSDGGGGWTAALALGLGGSMLAALLHGMVDSAYFVPDLALVFWWSVASLLVAERSLRHL